MGFFYDASEWTMTGSFLSVMHSFSMTISLMVESEGTSNMRSRRRFSAIIRRARAPVPASLAFWAMARRASGLKWSFTPSS